MRRPSVSGNVRRALQDGSISVTVTRNVIAVIGTKRRIVFKRR